MKKNYFITFFIKDLGKSHLIFGIFEEARMNIQLIQEKFFEESERFSSQGIFQTDFEKRNLYFLLNK